MVYQQHRLAIPSNTEYSVPQLRMMILKWKRSSAVKSELRNGIAYKCHFIFAFFLLPFYLLTISSIALATRPNIGLFIPSLLAPDA
jgi:hypothetical protein